METTCPSKSINALESECLIDEAGQWQRRKEKVRTKEKITRCFINILRVIRKRGGWLGINCPLGNLGVEPEDVFEV